MSSLIMRKKKLVRLFIYVIGFFSDGIRRSANLDPGLAKLNGGLHLTAGEKADLGGIPKVSKRPAILARSLEMGSSPSDLERISNLTS